MGKPDINLNNLSEEQKEALVELLEERVHKNKKITYSNEDKERILREWDIKGVMPPERRKISDWLDEGVSEGDISNSIHMKRHYNCRGWRKPGSNWFAHKNGTVYSTDTKAMAFWRKLYNVLAFMFKPSLPMYQVERETDGWRLTVNNHTRYHSGNYFKSWEEATGVDKVTSAVYCDGRRVW